MREALQQLLRRVRNELPGGRQIWLCNLLSPWVRRKLWPPQSQCHGARAAIQRIHSGGAVSQTPAAVHNAASFLEGGGKTCGEACGTRIRFFIVSRSILK